jgi:hypothetical protein
VAVRETVNAAKERFGKADLRRLFEGATRIDVAKGKKVVSFDPGKAAAADIAAVALGPTGNLRAPAMRLGKTWMIGFNEEAYAERFR